MSRKGTATDFGDEAKSRSLAKLGMTIFGGAPWARKAARCWLPLANGCSPLIGPLPKIVLESAGLMFFRQAEGHPRGPRRFEVREEGLHPLVSAFYTKAVPVPEESAGEVWQFSGRWGRALQRAT